MGFTLLIAFLYRKAYGSGNYNHHAVHYIPSTYLSNWKFVPFDHFCPMPPPPIPCLWSDNHKSNLFFYELFFLKKDSTYKYWIIQYLSLSDLFHLVLCPQGPSMLSQMRNAQLFTIAAQL